MSYKEILNIEFRYYDIPKIEHFSGYTSKFITIGIFDTLEEAIIEGNKAIEKLSKHFEVRQDDKFTLNYLFGNPKRLVTNTCYSTNNIQYFAKITKLNFEDLTCAIKETFASSKRYKIYKSNL